MASKEKIFQKKVEELIAKAQNLENAEVKKVIRILSDARQEVAATVAVTDWQAYHLPQLKSAIERAMQQFGDKYGVDLRDAQWDFWRQGVDLVDLPLRQVGIYAAIPEIDVTVLNIMQGYSTDLVTDLSRSAVKNINGAMTRGLLGQKSPYEVMQEVGRNLKDPSIFKSIAARAETITRNECGRVLEMASQARLEAAAPLVPGLQKQWFHGGYVRMPRPSHVAAVGQIRDVNKPFDVGGEKLMYPRDPAGSAKNTINCHCYKVPYHPDWDAAAGGEVEPEKGTPQIEQYGTDKGGLENKTSELKKIMESVDDVRLKYALTAANDLKAKQYSGIIIIDPAKKQAAAISWVDQPQRQALKVVSLGSNMPGGGTKVMKGAINASIKAGYGGKITLVSVNNCDTLKFYYVKVGFSELRGGGMRELVLDPKTAKAFLEV